MCACNCLIVVFMQVKIWEATPDSMSNGIQYGRLLTKLSAPIGSSKNLAQFQLLLQAMTSLTANELPLTFGGDRKMG